MVQQGFRANAVLDALKRTIDSIIKSAVFSSSRTPYYHNESAFSIKAHILPDSWTIIISSSNFPTDLRHPGTAIEELWGTMGVRGNVDTGRIASTQAEITQLQKDNQEEKDFDQWWVSTWRLGWEKWNLEVLETDLDEALQGKQRVCPGYVCVDLKVWAARGRCSSEGYKRVSWLLSDI